MQPARGVIDLAAELTAGMQRGHDDFQRRLGLELGVHVHRDAAAVVAHGQHVVVIQLDLDAAGVAGNGFVHRVIEDFGGEMMQRRNIGAADIHAGPPPHRLQAFEDLDILGCIALY